MQILESIKSECTKDQRKGCCHGNSSWAEGAYLDLDLALPEKAASPIRPAPARNNVPGSGTLAPGPFSLCEGLRLRVKAASDSVSAEWSSNESVKMELPVDDKAVQSGETASLWVSYLRLNPLGRFVIRLDSSIGDDTQNRCSFFVKQPFSKLTP